MTAAARRDSAPTLGILGGTGLYEIDGLSDLREERVETPFGPPSGPYVLGTLEGCRVAFLSRHGAGHCLLPAEVNYRANIFGFKLLGVDRIVSINSVGSLREEMRPRDLVLPDQFIDRTRRPSTFFGGGIVAHVSFARAVCPDLRRLLFGIAEDRGFRAHPAGTYICIDGPAFSSRAESRLYRAWGCDVIGMTAATEAKLCLEAEICYATMSLVTDYDAWHEEEAPVTVDMILANLEANIDRAKAVIKAAAAALPAVRSGGCDCGESLRNTIVTSRDRIPQRLRRDLAPIVGKYLGEA